MKDIFVISIISHIEIDPPLFKYLNIAVSILASSVIAVDEKHQIQTLHEHNPKSDFYLIDNNASEASITCTPLTLNKSKEDGEVFHQSKIDESITLYKSLELSIKSALQDIIKGGMSSIDNALELLSPYTDKDDAAPMTLRSSKIVGEVNKKTITDIIQSHLLDEWHKLNKAL